MQSNPRVAVLGCGYWGKNLVRTYHQLGNLSLVCDVREEVRRDVEQRYGVETTASVREVLENPAIDAVVIAAPAAQHFTLVRMALLAGKDVFVEKPLALKSFEGQELTELAIRQGKILMVGHILEYHPAIVEIKRMIREGELGRIQYIYSSRLNLGKLRTEENILWSFAPHDICAVLALLGEMPEKVSSQGGSYVNPHIVDTTLSTCSFRDGVKAHIFVSWLHPFKEQKLTVVGEREMVVFDDVEPENKLRVYSHHIDWAGRIPVAQKDGSRVIPIERLEPLMEECKHFLDCLRNRTQPVTDGQSAVQVLQVLEACEHSLRSGGQPVSVWPELPRYTAHPTAVIDEPCEIGDGTKIWHFSHVMAHSQLGENCNLGQNVVVSPGVKVGNNVKIQNNVSLYTGVTLEDDVFCGPSMVFTNVINPRSHIERKHEYRPTLVKQGASIGANATIVCGTTIGRYAFIAAGAVVNSDVPDYALMMGVPARQAGWICYCGIRLANKSGQVTCSACERQYYLNDGQCMPLRFQPEVTAA